MFCAIWINQSNCVDARLVCFRIANKPTVCGEYWAYVFPLAAFATAWLRYATVMGTRSAEFVGLFFMAFATLAFILVIGRDAYHAYMCVVGKANWGDPILLVESSHYPSRHQLAARLDHKATDSMSSPP